MSVILTAVSFAADNTQAVQMNFADDPQTYLTEWGTTTIPTIAAGKAFYIGGAAYRSSGTGAIGGTVPSSDGTYYLKVVIATLAVEWETSTAAYSWNEDYGGWYNGLTAMLLPCEVEYRNSGEWLNKQWINPRSPNEKISSVNMIRDKGGSGFTIYVNAGPTVTENQIFDALDAYIPNTGDSIGIRGGIEGVGAIPGSSTLIANLIRATRTSSVDINLLMSPVLGFDSAGALVGTLHSYDRTVSDGDSTDFCDGIGINTD